MLSKNLLLFDFRFYLQINEIVNISLLASTEFMPAMHLREPVFVYCVCGHFTKTNDRIKTKKTGDSKYIYIEIF